MHSDIPLGVSNKWSQSLKKEQPDSTYTKVIEPLNQTSEKIQKYK